MGLGTWTERKVIYSRPINDAYLKLMLTRFIVVCSIYTYPLHPHLHDPFPVDPLTHPALEMRTFYPKLALSPDGAHLAAGSSSGAIVLWDTRAILKPGGERSGVKLVGHTPDMDVCGLDWAEDMVYLFRAPAFHSLLLTC